MKFVPPGLLVVSSLWLLAHCRPAEIDPYARVRDAATDTLSLVQVRALDRGDAPGQILLTNPGQTGLFVLDRSDRQTFDNTGLVLVTANGFRYRRQYSGPANLGWFGISPADDDIGPELQLAVNVTTGEIIIPDGSYTQRQTVRIRSNLTLRGNPGKVTLTLPAGYVSLINPVNTTAPLENVLIDGINWVVTAQAKGSYGVFTIDGPTFNNITIQNCRSTDEGALDSTNFITMKVQAGKTARNIRVRNNDVRAKRMGCEIFNHDNIDVYAGVGVVVSDNIFHECKFGISLSGPLDSLTVANNLVRNCSLYGVEIAGALRNVRITDNRFEGRFDKFIEGSNDGFGNGSIVGGQLITGNQTVGTVVGGIQMFNAGKAQFSNNTIRMTGRLELLSPSSAGGMYENNLIEGAATHAIICDNAPNNTFRNNQLSNRGAKENFATFRAYGDKATGIVVTNNRISKGPGGTHIDAVNGATLTATDNVSETGVIINLKPQRNVR